MTERVGQRASRDFVRLQASLDVSEARLQVGSARHVVIVDDQSRRPLGLIEADTLAEHPASLRLDELGRQLPPLVTVQQGLGVTEAVTAPAMRALGAHGAGALVLDGEALVGVWPSRDLAASLLDLGSGIRSAQDWALEGVIRSIPLIHRQCCHAEAQTVCADLRSFPEKPDRMPDCRNPRAMRPHLFVWDPAP